MNYCLHILNNRQKLPFMKRKFTSFNLKFCISLLGLTIFFTQINAQGNALNFDGQNDHVIIGPSGGLYAVGSAYTKEAWILKGNWFTAENIISSKDPFWLEFDQHVNASNDYIIVTQEHYDVIDPLPNDNNHWVHMAVTFSGGAPGTGTMKLYRNGVLVDSHTYTGSEPYTSASGQNYIGGIFDTDAGIMNYFFTGLIDEVRIYDVALSAAQIQADMVSTTSADPTHLKAYYNFDEGTPGGANTGIATLTDLSGNGNHGTLVNFAKTGFTSNWVGSYAMVVPTANAATNITSNSFDLNWTVPAFGAGSIDNYRIEVSASSNFSSLITPPFYVSNSTFTYSLTGLSPNTTYYYKVSADKNQFTTQGAFSNIITVTTLGVLPVNLLSLNVSKGKDANLLQWSTSFEQNSKSFEVQRSIDGINFTSISTIYSNGNSSSTKQYQYLDNLTLNTAQFYYYRLKMLDINGSYKYSDVVLIKNAQDATITLYPNPSTDNVIINITDKSLLNTVASVSDISGKLIQNVNIIQTATSVNIKNYSLGVYVVTFANGQSLKLLKK